MSNDDFAVDLTPYEVNRGREILVEGPTGDRYAGAWARGLVEDAAEDELVLGHFDDPVRGEGEPARFPLDAFLRHAAYVGATGYGKSSVMLLQATQLADRGHGFLFVDVKGSDSLKLLEAVPEERLDDVVWVEPGNPDVDKTVGFNFFKTFRDPDDPLYDAEVTELVADFASILKAGKVGWGATIDSVVEAVAHQLIRAEKDYTPLDMYKILADDDEREKFAKQFGDDIESIYLERLAQMSAEELDPLLRRLQKWADNVGTRHIAAHPNGHSIPEMVGDDRIVILRLSNIPANQVKALVATTVVRGIWAAKRAHGGYDHEDHAPYFVFLDEFDMLAQAALPLNDMLSKGRAYGLGLVLGFQQFEQLDEEYQDAVLGNCDNLFVFNPGSGNVTGAGKLAQVFNIGANRLLELPPFRFVGRLHKNTWEKTDPFDIECIAPFPPVRDARDAEAAIERSLAEYGVEELDAEEGEYSEYGV